MEKKHQEELFQLREEAIAILQEGKHTFGYARHVQALIMPSFGDWEGYDILLPIQDSQRSPLGTKTVWRHTIDTEKFRTPVVRLQHGLNKLSPTIETHET